MKRETTKALAAFNEYCLLGPRRSLAKLGEMYGKSTAYVRQLERWSSAHDWNARAREYDTYFAAKMREKYEREKEADFQLIRDLLLKQINANAEPSPASQIQAAKLLLEYYVVAGSLAQMKEQLQTLQAKLEEIEAMP